MLERPITHRCLNAQSNPVLFHPVNEVIDILLRIRFFLKELVLLLFPSHTELEAHNGLKGFPISELAAVKDLSGRSQDEMHQVLNVRSPHLLQLNTIPQTLDTPLHRAPKVFQIPIASNGING